MLERRCCASVMHAGHNSCFAMYNVDRDKTDNQKMKKLADFNVYRTCMFRSTQIEYAVVTVQGIHRSAPSHQRHASAACSSCSTFVQVCTRRVLECGVMCALHVVLCSTRALRRQFVVGVCVEKASTIYFTMCMVALFFCGEGLGWP